MCVARDVCCHVIQSETQSLLCMLMQQMSAALACGMQGHHGSMAANAVLMHSR